MNSVSFCVRIASSSKLVISLIYTWILIHSYCQTVCLTDPSNDQLVKDEGAQIFYSIRSQTKPIGIGVNCEIPHNPSLTMWIQQLKPMTRLWYHLLDRVPYWSIQRSIGEGWGGHKSFIAFDRKPSPLVFERIVKSLTVILSLFLFSG